MLKAMELKREYSLRLPRHQRAQDGCKRRVIQANSVVRTTIRSDRSAIRHGQYEGETQYWRTSHRVPNLAKYACDVSQG